MKKKYRKLGRYIRVVANQMGLRDWYFELVPEAPNVPDREDGAITAGSCEPLYGRKRARLRFPESFFDETPQDQRVIVVHELLHCHFVPIQWSVQNVSGLIPGEAWHVYSASVSDEMEKHVDAVSTAWAETLPLPT